MRRKLLVTMALLVTGALPAVALAQSPFSDYRSAAQRQYGGGGGGGTTTTTTTPPATATAAQLPTTTAATTATTATTDEPGSGQAPGGGSGNGNGANPDNASGNTPGSGQAPGGASGAPVKVAPSATATSDVKDGLPFTGSNLTPLVLLALALVSGGLFLRVAERRYRAGRRTS